MLKRFAFALFCWPIVAIAQEVDPEFLEQPGMVWVSADLPIAVQTGLMLPQVPYLRFEDGQLETGFLSRLAFIYSADCKDEMTCKVLTDIGPYRSGPYDVQDGLLTSDAPPLDAWVFDRLYPDMPDHIEASDFLISGQTLVTRVGDDLVQQRPEGPRRYVLLPEAHIWDAMNLIVTFGQPIAAGYDCTFSTLEALSEVPDTDRDLHQRALAAHVEVGRVLSQLDREVRIIETLSPEIADNLPPEEAALANQNQLVEFGARMAVVLMSEDLIDLSPDGVNPAPPTELRPEVMQEFAEIIPSIAAGAPDPDALLALLDDMQPLLMQSAYLQAEFDMAEARGQDAYQAVICNP